MKSAANFAIKLSLILSIVIIGGMSSAVMAANSGVTFQGRILKPNGDPLSGVNTQFRMQIRTPDSQNCLFYEEVQMEDLTGKDGAFSLTINDGTGTRTDSTGLTLDRIFANRGTFNLNSTTCTTGTGVYSPNASDGRNLVVYFKDETMATWEPIPAQRINYVPFAFESKQIQGYTADSLVRVVNGSGEPITGLSPLSNTQYTELLALIAGTSTQFERAGRLGGASLPTLGAGQAGQSLTWNGTGWTTANPTATVGADSVASANIVNGSITGADLATNIAITTTSNFVTSGTVTSNITTARDFRIYDSDAAPNENYISIKAPASLAANYNYVWPATYGTATHVLTTDGLGGLTWSAPASSSQWLNGPSNAIGYTAGAVGIGTTTPTPGYGLEVAGNVALWRVVGSNGGAAVPTYTTGSGNGMFSPNGGADLGFSTNGAEKMRILAGGSVGIGMTAPSARLNIAAGTATGGTAPLKFTRGVLLGTEEDGAMEFDSSGLWFTIGSTRYLIPMNTTAGNYSNVQTIGNTTGSITMTPMSGNAVIVNSAAVSTSSTTGALIVNGGVGVAGAINSAGNISSGGTVSATNSLITPQIYGSTAASGNIRIDGTSDATKGNVFLASAGGSVGIGTTNPAAKLDVEAGVNKRSLFVSGGHDTIESIVLRTQRSDGTAKGQLRFDQVGGLSFDTGEGALDNFSSMSSVMYLKRGGLVGIGTTSPAGILDIKGALGNITYGADGNSMQFSRPGSNYISASGTGGDLRLSTGPAAGFVMANGVPTGALYLSGGTGHVGIGTTSPSYQLDVAGTVSGSLYRTRVNSTAANPSLTNSSGTMGLYFESANNMGLSTASTSRLHINATGQVGVGTTSPNAKFEVADSAGTADNSILISSPDVATASSTLAIKAGANSASLQYLPAATSVSGLGGDIFSGAANSFVLRNTSGKTVVQSSEDVSFQVGTGYNTKLKIDASNGNVGVGTTLTSTYKLNVLGEVNATGYRINGVALSAGGGDLKADGTVPMTGAFILKDGTAASPSTGFATATTTGLYNGGSNTIGFATGGVTAFKIVSGTSAAYIASGKFRGASGAATGATYGFENDTTAGMYGGSGAIGFSTNSLSRIHILADGKVGVGITNPSENLDVNGNVRATSFIATSDRRLKIDIQETPGLDIIEQLTGVSWKWKADGKSDAGVIAQTVEKAYPVAVVTDPQTGLKAVKYNALIAPLIQSTKELHRMCLAERDVNQNQAREIASLKSENEELKELVLQMKKRLDKLEDKIK